MKNKGFYYDSRTDSYGNPIEEEITYEKAKEDSQGGWF